MRRGSSDWHLYGRLLSHVLPLWYFFLLSLCGYALYSVGTVLLADLLQFLLDSLNNASSTGRGIISSIIHSVFPGMDEGEVSFARTAVPIAIIVLALLRSLGFFMGNYFMNHVARNLIHELRCQLFSKMLGAPSDYFDRHSQGVLISRITFNVEQVTGAATKASKIIVRESLTVIALLTYMLYLNWRLCLVFIAVAPLIALVVGNVGKRFRRYSRRIQSSMGQVTQVSSEAIGAYREIRMLSAQPQQRARFEAASDYNRRQSLKMALADAISTPVLQTLLALAMAALVWFALSPDVLSGFSAGSLVAFLTAAGQVGKPIRQLSEVQGMLQSGLAAADDIFFQLDQTPETDQGTRHTPRARGDISFRQLAFAYPGTEQRVLDNVSLEICAGQTVALVGRSGCGKTTLVQLLARFYTPQSGELLLDGVSIEQYTLANLRNQLAIVAQDAPLFRDTVYNNIAYGALADADESKVMDAARSAHATEFIERLPQGFQTVLGDDGGGLSGGQRQRIALARAILKDAPVLILDEATSALDYESEFHIQQALQSITADRTTIIIAHRLSTVESADTIVVMDSGRIVATGRHDQLLAEGGLYAQLYSKEFTN
jgi:ATP-binding cassette, subfamily B, bacterial MsbA